MTETTFSQANPAFAPHPHTDDEPEPIVEAVEEPGAPAEPELFEEEPEPEVEEVDEFVPADDEPADDE